MKTMDPELVVKLCKASLASNSIDMLRGLFQEDARRRTHEGEGA